MKDIPRLLVVLFTVTVVSLGGAYVSGRLYQAFKIHQLRGLDHGALLRDCRILLSRNRLDVRQGKWVGIAADKVPASIKKLRPAYIIVEEDRVVVCISTLPRLYLLAFDDGMSGNGKEMLIDGLWYSFVRKDTPERDIDSGDRDAP